MPTFIQPPFHLQQQQGLQKIRADLQPFTDNPTISKIVLALENPELAWGEGIEADKEYINKVARNKLLNFIEHAKQIEANKNLFLAIFNSLMIFAYYWPLNDYKKNESKPGYSFICPISLQELDETNKFILPSGTLIDKEVLPQFLIDCTKKNCYQDPVTRYEFKNGMDAFLKVNNRQQAHALFSNPNYQLEKTEKIKSAARKGLTIGVGQGLFFGFVLLVWFHAFIPIVFVPTLFTGLALLGGVVNTLIAAKRTRDILNAEEAPTLAATPQVQQQHAMFANSMRQIKTQAATQYENSTQEISQKLGALQIRQTPNPVATPTYKKSHAWQNAPAQIRQPLLPVARRFMP